MPIETGRVIKRKRINLPSGATVDIPVITQITFLDVVGQGQEYEFHIENSAAAKRDVHIATIPGNRDATDESGGGGSSDLKVERIDIWRVLDVVDRGQESFIHFDNKTVKEPPEAPPYFTTHEKTHVVKYINTPDDGNFIRSELIDRFKVLDVVAQGQETEYFLFNPPDNIGISGLTLGTDTDGNPTVAVDPGLADISDSSNGVDPPYRTDPFQNIIDWSGEIPTGVGIEVHAFIYGIYGGGFSGSAHLEPSEGSTIQYLYTNEQQVIGTVTGMGGTQDVPINYFLRHQAVAGTTIVGTFNEEIAGTATGNSVTLTFDFSGITFMPATSPDHWGHASYSGPHNFGPGGGLSIVTFDLYPSTA